MKALLQASKQRARSCKGVECPNVMCPALPACRDEGHAVCRAGRCAVELRPTAGCAAAGSTPDGAVVEP